MNSKNNIKKYIIETVCVLHILLFVYASVSKLLDFENFKTQLGQSPILSLYAEYVSVLVIGIELLTAVLLCIPRFKFIGLWISAALMIMFTTYIYIILNFSPFIPCSCGGILEKLSWHEHLLFNLLFTGLASLAILLRSTSKQTIRYLLLLTIFTISSVTVLFLFTDDIMKKENPFIRRLPNASAAKTKELDVRNNSYYIAGIYNKKIYLGNRLAPLQVLEVDENLKTKKKHTIKLSRENFPFKALEVRVKENSFYVSDGTVPVIYKGLISDWKAAVIIEGKFYFSQIVFMNDKKIAFRAQQPSTGENMLGITDEKSSFINFEYQALQKQHDGIFDTDGTIQYSGALNKLVYTYYYRNQYLVMDTDLNVLSRANTIDTTKNAKLKVVKLEQSGDIKLAAPPYMVNRNTSVCNNLLFVNSMLRGRYEGDDVWKHASVIDVYDMNQKTYLLSFYVYDENNLRMKSFYASESSVYIISGHYLLKYQYGKNMKSKFK